MIFLIKNGMRFCEDRKWRAFANFGTFPECVKLYKKLGWAKRIALQLGAQVVQLPDKIEINAAGEICYCGISPEYKMEDFIVK